MHEEKSNVPLFKVKKVTYQTHCLFSLNLLEALSMLANSFLFLFNSCIILHYTYVGNFS